MPSQCGRLPQNAPSKDRCLRVAVMVSGNGSNLQALIDHANCGNGDNTTHVDNFVNVNCLDSNRLQTASYQIVAVISNIGDAYALERAKNVNISTFAPVRGDGRALKLADFETKVLDFLADKEIDLLVLAGFMRVLSAQFLAQAPRAINLHPSLLPAYKGLHTHARALQAGERMAGCSVHWVDETLDGGALIAQACVPIQAHDSVPNLQQRVQQAEHWLLPFVLDMLGKGMMINHPLKFYFEGK